MKFRVHKRYHARPSSKKSYRKSTLSGIDEASERGPLGFIFENISLHDHDNELLQRAFRAAIARTTANGCAGNFALELARTLQEMTAPVPAAPSEQKPLYAERADKTQRASEFLTTHWKPEIESGTISQKAVRRHDPKLLVGLEAEFRGNREGLLELLPNQTVVNTRVAETIVEGPLTPGKRSHALSVLRASRALRP